MKSGPKSNPRPPVADRPRRTIPFTAPTFTEREAEYVRQVIDSGQLVGGGRFTEACQAWLESNTGCGDVLLTTSCTSALEIAALLADIGPGDEVIMPSFTFVSTANAFVLRGAVPVFVDNRADTLNIDETRIEAAITPRTKAIVPVHYAGVACDMDVIGDIARRHGLMVIEDAAQGVCASYKGRALGTLSQLGSYSFHGTKNIVAGEGGALLVNDPGLIERAEIIREKGTNRQQFLLGAVDKYTWVDVGSSYVPGELAAALLLAQLEAAQSITTARLRLWNRYHRALAPLEGDGRLRRPIVPQDCAHNAHIYYVLMPDRGSRDAALKTLAAAGIGASFHFVPLHTSPAGQRFARSAGSLETTDDTAGRLLRLPLHAHMPEDDQDYVVANLERAVAAS